jgi:hypothetical protein
MAVVLLATLGIVLFAQRGSSPSIVGVWRVSERTITGPEARKITNPQPGLRIFTQRHYSVTEVDSDKPRPELPPEGQRSDKQYADAFDPFTARAGTYEIKGNEITTRPIADKSPNAMRAGNFITFTFMIEGNTLTITGKANQAGPIANPTTTKYTRVE